jgi:hypothetical protein
MAPVLLEGFNTISFFWRKNQDAQQDFLCYCGFRDRHFVGLRQGGCAIREPTGDGSPQGWIHLQRAGDKELDKRNRAAVRIR